MKISILASFFCAGLFLNAQPAFSAIIHADDSIWGDQYHYDPKGNWEKIEKNNLSLADRDHGTINPKLCDPLRDAWSSDKDKDFKSDKINYTPSHHDVDPHQSQINYPPSLISFLSDFDHHGHDKHHDNDGDHDSDDRKKIVNYYREICDHKNDPSYDGHRCDPADLHTTPLPGSLFLFVSSMLLLSVTYLLRRQYRQARFPNPRH